MDQDNYEQETLGQELIGDQAKFLADGSELQLLVFHNKIIGAEMPNSVALKVVQTEPGAKGDTATQALKPAEVETGVTVMVPLFVNEGDVIKVDTRTGAYQERQK